ncbi:PaaI family thioesterase [Maricaulis sp.]|uniref:PaaI family thioesterase n=1 Tax=unclassified Maricaulis TaxID=2632371 RepID=UPI0025BCB2F7|nr:PaaI family thioesterase [Maricaulis sp.]
MTPQIQTEGEFKGWQYWPEEPFESHVGPFYRTVDEEGVIGAFRAERKHMNAGGVVHGGCLMSFADFMLFSIAWDAFEDGSMGVTMTFNSEFLDGAPEGALVTSRGEVTRMGKSTIFVRGMIYSEDRPVMSFSGSIRRFTPRP